MTNFELDMLIWYVSEVTVLYCKHFICHAYEIMKWKFEEIRVHISFISSYFQSMSPYTL